MRLPAIIAAVLLAAGGLAGCFGSEDEPQTPASTGNGGNDPLGGGGAVGTIKVRAPLATSLSTTAAAWIQSGTAIDIAASAPANANGTVTYTWAVGPLPGTTEVVAQKLDTGSAKAADYIQPGKSAQLKFDVAGNFVMHCHPHPFMLQNVTVIEGFQGPKVVHVNITDGTKLEESRFVPDRIVIAPGTTVVYHNAGQQPHTATLMTQEPVLKLAATGTTPSSNVTVEGEGWQRVVVVATDSEGRVGFAEHHVYATAELPSFETQTFTFEFLVGGAPEQVVPAQTQQFSLEQGGKLFLNLTGSDAASAAGQTLAAFEVHLVKQGETQDTVTGDPAADHALSATVAAGLYTLSVKATEGVEPTATVTIEVVYELVPPPPAAPKQDDGHGGHAH